MVNNGFDIYHIQYHADLLWHHKSRQAFNKAECYSSTVTWIHHDWQIILKVCAFGYHTEYHVNNTYMIPYIPDKLLYDSSHAIML